MVNSNMFLFHFQLQISFLFAPFPLMSKTREIGRSPLSVVNHSQKQYDRVLLVMQGAAGIHAQQILEQIAASCNIRFDKRFAITLMIQ